MKRVNGCPRPLSIAAALAGAAVLTACATDDADSAATSSPEVETITTTATAAPEETTPETVTATPTETTATASEEPTMGIPGSRFVEKIAAVPEVDAEPYRSSHIFPSMPGLQFKGPDGTFCEMYGEAGGQVETVNAMCTHQGEGDINAVSVTQGEPATTHNVNRIFIPHENTVLLEPGGRLTDGPVSCAVAEGEVRVMCTVDSYSFAVSKDGLELGG